VGAVFLHFASRSDAAQTFTNSTSRRLQILMHLFRAGPGGQTSMRHLFFHAFRSLKSMLHLWPTLDDGEHVLPRSRVRRSSTNYKHKLSSDGHALILMGTCASALRTYTTWFVHRTPFIQTSMGGRWRSDKTCAHKFVCSSDTLWQTYMRTTKQTRVQTIKQSCVLTKIFCPYTYTYMYKFILIPRDTQLHQ